MARAKDARLKQEASQEKRAKTIEKELEWVRQN